MSVIEFKKFKKGSKLKAWMIQNDEDGGIMDKIYWNKRNAQIERKQLERNWDEWCSVIEVEVKIK